MKTRCCVVLFGLAMAGCPTPAGGASRAGDDGTGEGEGEGGEGEPAPGVCNADGLCWESPTPMGRPMAVVASIGADEAWLAADADLLGSDGVRFNHEIVEVEDTLQRLRALAVLAPGVLAAVPSSSGGLLLRGDDGSWAFDGSAPAPPFFGVAATAPDDLWLTGSTALFHFDGASWQQSLTGFHTTTVVDARARDDVWIAGGGEVRIRHFDGVGWSEPLDLRGTGTIRGLAAVSSGEAWVLHSDQTLTRVRGVVSERVQPDLGFAATVLLARGADDVFLFGAAGQFGHFDGAAWSVVEAPELPEIVGGDDGGGAMWLGGAHGEVFRVLGGAPQRVNPPVLAAGALGAVALAQGGDSAPDVWVQGEQGSLFRRDAGGGWSAMPVAAGSHGLFVRAPGEPWVLNGGALVRVIGGEEEVAVVGDVVAACATESGAVFALTGSEVLVSVDGASFATEALPPFTGPFTALTPLLCLPDDEVFIPAHETPVALWRRFGRWATVEPPLGSNNRSWASAVDDVWSTPFLTRQASHYDGAVWLTFDVLDGEVVRDLEGSAADDVWFVGDHGRVARFDGTGFERVDLPSDTTLISVDVFAADDVWAVAQNGPLFHWDGNAWSSTPATVPDVGNQAGQLTHAVLLSPTVGFALRASSGVATLSGGNWIAGDPAAEPSDAARIDARSSTDVFALERGGNAWHFDGAGWSGVGAGVDMAVAADDVRLLQSGAVTARWDGAAFIPALTIPNALAASTYVSVGDGRRVLLANVNAGDPPADTFVEDGATAIKRSRIRNVVASSTGTDGARRLLDDRGFIFRRDGASGGLLETLAPVAVPPFGFGAGMAAAVHGDAAAMVAFVDQLWRVEGQAWVAMAAPPGTALLDLASARDGTTWVVGDASSIFRIDAP